MKRPPKAVAPGGLIKVLHILSDSNIGGAGHHLLALADAIDQKAFAFEVALPAGGKLVPLLARRGIPYAEVPHIAERSFSWPGVRALYRVLRRARPHIVHTHASLSGRVAARLAGKCRVIYTRHSVYPPRRRVGGGLLNRGLSDAVIAVSPAARDNLAAEGVRPEDITVIYNGVAPARARGADRARFGVPPGAFALAHIARLAEDKGHDYVLDAAKQCPGVCVLLAGDGERRAHLAARLAEEHIDNVRLLGFVEDVDALVWTMDAQLNASFGTEATSLALLTGMSAGKPAIATDYGGNPYVIADGDNGLVVPCKDADALAGAIRRLRDDAALYARLADGARAVYARRFTAEGMARQTEALYRKVLAWG